MSHSYFPNDQQAADAASTLAELETEEFPIHSGDHPHHHHHHRHEHHKHEHHRHEHEAPYIVNQGDTVHQGSQDTIHVTDGPKTKTVGTVSFALSQITAVIRPLSKRDRSFALGHAIAKLIESDHLDGTGDLLTHVIASVNRYHIEE